MGIDSAPKSPATDPSDKAPSSYEVYKAKQEAFIGALRSKVLERIPEQGAPISLSDSRVFQEKITPEALAEKALTYIFIKVQNPSDVTDEMIDEEITGLLSGNNYRLEDVDHGYSSAA